MNDEMILVPRAELVAWAKAWLHDHGPNDGTDCVTPFDTYLLKSPVDAKARPAKPAECVDGCPPQQVCDHCQWPPGPDAEVQAQDGGEVVYIGAWAFDQLMSNKYVSCLLDTHGRATYSDGRPPVRLCTSPPSAPVGVAVAQVRRGGKGAPHDALYVGLIPRGPATPEVKEGDLLYLAQQPAAVDETAELVGLLDEVRSHFTRDDDLPDDLLPRIDAALRWIAGGEA